ncbi:MAG: DUF6364 family protein [Treponema sp.]
MDSSVIASMKKYAADHKSSISHIVETFFKNLLSSQAKSREISPLVQELSGILPAHEDDKDEYISYLEAKYE